MRISMNGTNAQAGIQAGRINKPMEMDSFSKSIHNQISNAQKQLQELSENKDMSMEEKMKRRQEIQQQITDLNNQLRQCEFPYKSRVMATNEPLKTLKVPYVPRNPMK